MAVTSVDVNQEMIREIKKLLNLKTDREVIDEGLKQLLARSRQKRLLENMLSRSFTDEEMNPPVIEYPL